MLSSTRKHQYPFRITFNTAFLTAAAALAAFCLSAFCLSACSASSSQVTRAEEIEAGTATIEWLDEQYGLVRYRPLYQMLDRVTKRLSSGLYGRALERQGEGIELQEFAGLPWQVLVINSPAANAFSLGAGAIVITRGMIHETRSEAELAAVISHEMAHQILGHTREALQRAKEGASAPHAAFTLEDEIAADRLGLKILHVARYDLRHALSALSIAYRPLEGGVASLPSEWLTLRMAHLHQELDIIGEYQHATQSTREFSRIRKTL